MDSPLLDSLRAAVTDRPDDMPLRLHLAELLLDAEQPEEAIGHLAAVLQRQPGEPRAQSLMARALDNGAREPAGASPAVHVEDGTADGTGSGKMDWRAYEEQFADSVPPRYALAGDEPEPVAGEADRVFDIDVSTVRLADVGGMESVKKRLELSFLAPLRNSQLRQLYGKSLRGGLLLYGPPGCGKTFFARAVAGEVDARFISVSIADVLNMWIGQSERNLHDIFTTARETGPCVIFLDEVDALGHKRSQLQSSAMRTLGNQLLAELDGMEGSNEGVFVLAATNAPWDVDPALRRPGRLDRTVFVAPPDAAARAAILDYHLRGRPIAGVQLQRLAGATEDFSGADLAHLCETAAEYAMQDSAASGQVRMIEQRDFQAALAEVKPSIRTWLATARNVATFANEGGTYDDLARFLKRRKLM